PRGLVGAPVGGIEAFGVGRERDAPGALPDGDRVDHFRLRQVDDAHRTGRSFSHVGETPVWREGDPHRLGLPVADRELREYHVGGEVDDGDVAAGFGGDVRPPSVGCDGHGAGGLAYGGRVYQSAATR